MEPFQDLKIGILYMYVYVECLTHVYLANTFNKLCAIFSDKYIWLVKLLGLHKPYS